jgi:DnaJ domain/WD40-like Beta Propeller Repeat
MKDYYEILDVPVTATRDEIKAQYRQLVRVYHPDRFRDAADKAYAEEKLKQINIAFQVLCGTSVQSPSPDVPVAPQPIAYPPVLDFGLVQHGTKRTLPLQIGNLGGPVTNLQLRCREGNSLFRISKGKAVYRDRAFPMNYAVSIDTRQLTPDTAHHEWIEVDLDGVLTHVELRLQISVALQQRLHAKRHLLSKRWLSAAFATLLLCLLVAALPAVGAFFPTANFKLPASFTLPFNITWPSDMALPSAFTSALYNLQSNEVLFSVQENTLPTLYVGGTGEPKGLGVKGRSAVGSVRSQQVAYLDVAGEVSLLALRSGESQQVTSDGEAKTALSWSADGERLAYLVGEGEESRIGVYDVKRGVRTELPGEVTSGVSHYAWSPDGKTLLFDLWQGKERRVYRIGVDGSGLQQLTRFDSWGGAWSADGRSVVVSSGRGLYRLDSQGRTATQVSQVAGESPSWSVDGKWLAYLTQEEASVGQQLWLLEVASGKTTLVASESVSYAWSPTGALLGYVTGRATGDTPLLYLWSVLPGQPPQLMAEVNEPLFHWTK